MGVNLIRAADSEHQERSISRGGQRPRVWIYALEVAACAVIVVTCVLLILPTYRPKDGHPHYRLTMNRVMLWHEQMKRFVEEHRRSPTSAEELRCFVRESCGQNGASYEDIARDAWGNELLVSIIDHGDESLLSIRSAGPDGEFDEFEAIPSGDIERGLFYPNRLSSADDPSRDGQSDVSP